MGEGPCNGLLKKLDDVEFRFCRALELDTQLQQTTTMVAFRTELTEALNTRNHAQNPSREVTKESFKKVISGHLTEIDLWNDNFEELPQSLTSTTEINNWNECQMLVTSIRSSIRIPESDQGENLSWNEQNLLFRHIRTELTRTTNLQEVVQFYQNFHNDQMSQWGEMDMARRALRDQWNKLIADHPVDVDAPKSGVVGEIRKLNPFWRKSSVMNALVTHMELMEPVDEMIYKYEKLWDGSGSYWVGFNRPERYRTCDEIIRFLNKERREIRTFQAGEWEPNRGPRDEYVKQIRRTVENWREDGTSLDAFCCRQALRREDVFGSIFPGRRGSSTTTTPSLTTSTTTSQSP